MAWVFPFSDHRIPEEIPISLGSIVSPLAETRASVEHLHFCRACYEGRGHFRVETLCYVFLFYSQVDFKLMLCFLRKAFDRSIIFLNVHQRQDTPISGISNVFQLSFNYKQTETSMQT